MKLFQDETKTRSPLSLKIKRPPLKALFLCAMLAQQGGLPAIAQSASTDLADFAKSLPQEVMRGYARSNGRYLQQISQIIFQISPDGIASREANQVLQSQQTANARAREISQLLRYDLDGDSEVTSLEISLLLPYLNANERAKMTLKVLELDTDADGDLSLSEIIASPNSTEAQQQAQRSNIQKIDMVMAFDYNADGRVDLGEVAEVLAAIDPADLKTAQTQRTVRAQPTTNCTAPKPQAGTELVFLSGNEGSALSTLAVGGQDSETTVGTVTISQGETPLYIFATAHDSIVWKFDGATDRIQQLVVQPRTTAQGPGAAVFGVAEDKIVFVEPKSCFVSYMHKRDSKSNARLTKFSRYLGKDFDHIVIGYAIRNFQVPPTPESLQSTVTETHPYRTVVEFSIGERSYELSAEGMYLAGTKPQTGATDQSIRSPIRGMMRFYRGGLIAMSPDDVHATAKIEPYDVLPAQAGLLQLIADGSVEYRSDRSYYIKEPIPRFPAGLYGAHSVTFVVATGVPTPAGSPGHSPVISEETGECIGGPLCRN